MADAKPRWFQQDAQELLLSPDTRYLKPVHLGYLLRLQCEAWLADPPCTLPGDPESLWRLAGADSLDEFRTNADPVLRLFKKKGNRLVSPYLLKRAEDYSAFVAKKREAGRLGGVASSSKRKQSPSTASASLNGCSSNGEAKPSDLIKEDLTDGKGQNSRGLQGKGEERKENTVGTANGVASPDETWQAILDVLSKKLNPQTFETWFRCARAKHVSDSGTLIVSVPNDTFSQHIGKNYREPIRTALAESGQLCRDVEFVPEAQR